MNSKDRKRGMCSLFSVGDRVQVSEDYPSHEPMTGGRFSLECPKSGMKGTIVRVRNKEYISFDGPYDRNCMSLTRKYTTYIVRIDKEERTGAFIPGEFAFDPHHLKKVV